jgi:hypothetical protein
LGARELTPAEDSPGSALDAPARRPSIPPLFWVVVALGVAVRLVIALQPSFNIFDMGSYARVADGLIQYRFHVYTPVNALTAPVPSWPYPPGFMPWTLVARALDHRLSGTFGFWIKLPLVIADAATALVVQEYLRRQGMSVPRRLAALVLVALGPPFIVISAYHGHLDGLATLPALVAVFSWDRRPGERPVVHGLLIGLGAAFKTVPGFMVLALLPTARGWRQRLLIAGSAVAVPLAMFVPFLVKDAAGVRAVASYQSFPGLGGASLLLQPNLVYDYFQLGVNVQASAVNIWISQHAGQVVLAALLLVGSLLLRKRTPALDSAVLLWLTVYVFLGGFFFQYVLWGMPFFIAASRRWSALLTAYLCLPIAILYLHFDNYPAVHVYQAAMIGLFAASVAVFALLLRRAIVAPVGARVL